jgi:hypothetical protein
MGKHASAARGFRFIYAAELAEEQVTPFEFASR